MKSNGKFHDFTREVTISCFAENYVNDGQNSDLEDSSIFTFQTIDVEDLTVNLFYDSGCGDLVVNKVCR